MRSSRRHRGGRSGRVVAALSLLAACGLMASCSGSSEGDAATGVDDGGERSGEEWGDLGLVALDALSIDSREGDRRVLVHVLVENGSARDLTAPWRLELSRRGEGIGLSECIGGTLPAGRVAHCAMWLDGGALEDGDLLEGRLDRSLDQFSLWDDDPKNDVRVTAIRWSGGDRELRVARWDLVPGEISEPGAVRFSFSVEGGHLVWLVTPWGDRTLLGGDPDDGTIDGRGDFRVPASGRVALVARNSLGAFVYDVRGVVVRAGDETRGEGRPAAPVVETARATTLDDGIFDVDQNELVLKDLAARLARID